jgi:porin
MIAFSLLLPLVVATPSMPARRLPNEEQTSKDQARAPVALGGPDGASQALENQAHKEERYDYNNFQRWAAPYVGWKKRMKSEHGLSFGLTAHMLYQVASDTLSGDDKGAGGIYRFQGSWVACGRESDNPGRLEWRLEARNELGGLASPTELGSDTGAAALNPGFGYNPVFDIDLAILNWTQNFNDSTAGVAVGRLAFDVYQDAFLFQTYSRGFLNRSFLVNPTIGTTGVGALGGVAKGFVTDNVWVGGQFHDANAVNGEFDVDTVEEGEWLKSVEIGWSPGIERFKTDRIQFTYWDKDARSLAGTSGGSGWVVSASWQATQALIPFTRFGRSNGGAGVAAERAASVGVEYAQRHDRTFSLGVGWADPSTKTFGAGLGDEAVIEASYNLELSPNFSLMPDIQLLLDPANNPNEDRVWVLGLRALISI